ncbi:hypothetical protein STRDD11_00733 [Streptococcus sp. DD11]|nr:hypothetical protein STRDD11_00733 [Streptococcus sp. DD11]
MFSWLTPSALYKSRMTVFSQKLLSGPAPTVIKKEERNAVQNFAAPLP